MEQTMNKDQAAEEEGRTAWRSVGAIAGAWADRVAVVRMARASGEPTEMLAARLGLAAE